MTIDITTLEHREALAWACEALRDPNKTTQGNGLKAQALFALSDPAKAAELIRQLVERAGVRVKSAGVKKFGPPLNFEAASIAFAEPLGEHNGLAFGIKTIPGIIARLLALPPHAGAEAVLRALRGEA